MSLATIHLRANIDGVPTPACHRLTEDVTGRTTDEYTRVTCRTCIRLAQTVTELRER